MGYRSKVIIGVKNGKLSNEFDKVLQKHDFNTNDNSTDSYLKVHTENDGMKFYTFVHTKWYESDDWCKDIMETLVSMEDEYELEEDNVVFCVGLGEDGTTHSEIGLYWEYVEQISEINLID